MGTTAAGVVRRGDGGGRGIDGTRDEGVAIADYDQISAAGNVLLGVLVMRRQDYLKF